MVLSKDHADVDFYNSFSALNWEFAITFKAQCSPSHLSIHLYVCELFIEIEYIF